METTGDALEHLHGHFDFKLLPDLTETKSFVTPANLNIVITQVLGPLLALSIVAPFEPKVFCCGTIFI